MTYDEARAVLNHVLAYSVLPNLDGNAQKMYIKRVKEAFAMATDALQEVPQAKKEIIKTLKDYQESLKVIKGQLDRIQGKQLKSKRNQ